VLYVWQFVFGLKGNSNSAKCGQHLVRSVANNKLNLQNYFVAEGKINYISINTSVFTSITNCTSPNMAITGLKTFPDMQF
jgi:hypothetical protein